MHFYTAFPLLFVASFFQRPAPLHLARPYIGKVLPPYFCEKWTAASLLVRQFVSIESEYFIDSCFAALMRKVLLCCSNNTGFEIIVCLNTSRSDFCFSDKGAGSRWRRVCTVGFNDGYNCCSLSTSTLDRARCWTSFNARAHPSLDRSCPGLPCKYGLRRLECESRRQSKRSIIIAVLVLVLSSSLDY